MTVSSDGRFRAKTARATWMNSYIPLHLSRCITNQFNDQLSLSLLAQLVRALNWYRRGQGSNPGKLEFFRLSFRNCIKVVASLTAMMFSTFVSILFILLFLRRFLRLILLLYSVFLPSVYRRLPIVYHLSLWLRGGRNSFWITMLASLPSSVCDYLA